MKQFTVMFKIPDGHVDVVVKAETERDARKAARAKHPTGAMVASFQMVATDKEDA